MKAKAALILSLILLSLVVLSTCALAQENTAEYWLNTGQELFANGSYEEAAQAYDKAIQIEPKNASAWLNKGYALDSLALTYGVNDPLNFTNTLQDAVGAYDKAIEIDPNSSEA